MLAAIMVVIFARMFHAHITASEVLDGVMVMIPIGPFSTLRKTATISAARVIAPVYMAAEMIMPVIPGA
jgi:hypothetical protein